MSDTNETTSELEGTELFDSLVNDAISKVAPTLNPVEDDEPVIEDKPEEKEKVEEKAPEVDARLLAREKALADKEKEFEQLYTKFKSESSAKAGEVSTAELRKLGETNVPGVLEKLGLDHEYVMDVLIAQKLGDKAPPALKEKLRDYNMKREIDSIRAERDAERKNTAANQYYQKVSSDAREYVTKSVDEKVAPVVSQVAKTDTDFVHNLVLRELENDARSRVARGETDGDIMSYADAVVRIEKMFSVVAKAVKKDDVVETKSKKTATVIPPLTRPKSDKPVDEIAQLEAEGLKAAKRTYERMEASRRR